jgi:hypothetical protein
MVLWDIAPSVLWYQRGSNLLVILIIEDSLRATLNINLVSGINERLGGGRSQGGSVCCVSHCPLNKSNHVVACLECNATWHPTLDSHGSALRDLRHPERELLTYARAVFRLEEHQRLCVIKQRGKLYVLSVNANSTTFS